MNKNIYDENAYAKEFDSNVISVQKKVWNKEEVFEFVLEETCFFPEQGGQTSDSGVLTDPVKGYSFEVLHVSIKDEVCYHYAKALDQSVSDGEVLDIRQVHGEINWDERFDKMQNHSGEHLVSGTVHRMFDYDNVGFSLSEQNCTMDFNGTFTDEDIDMIEKTVNRAVFENIEVIITFPSPEELEKLDYRSKKELKGDVRIVEFPGYDMCACCAPHVKRTGEIGLVKIVSAEHFKGGTRMTIRCGYRALTDYGRKLEACRGISQLLSTPIDDVLKGTEKLNQDLQKIKFELNARMSTILELKAKDVAGEENPFIFIEQADMNLARSAVNGMVGKSSGYCGIFIGNDDKGYSYIIGSGKKDCKELLNTLKSKAGTKGGGNEAMIQGNIPSKEKEIREILNLL